MLARSKKFKRLECMKTDFAFATITQFRRLRNKFINESLKQWMLKDGIKVSRFRLLPFEVKRGRSGQRNTSLVKYVRGYERSSICPLSTVLPSSRLQTLRPSPPGRAAERSPFLSSVQFKENACRSHAPIHSYGFASLVDTRYSCVWPVREFSRFLYMWCVLSHDTDCIPENCFAFPLTRESLSLRRLFCYDPANVSFDLNVRERVWINVFANLSTLLMIDIDQMYIEKPTYDCIRVGINWFQIKLFHL